MDFKRLELDAKGDCLSRLIKHNREELDVIEGFKWLENDTVLVVKIQKRTNSDNLGVPTGNGTSNPLNSFINDDQICELEFVVVFAESNAIYYTGNQKEVTTIIRNFFKINVVKFLPNVNLDDISVVNKIITTDNLPNQVSIGEERLNPVKMISELSDAINPSKIKMEFDVKIKAGKLFGKKLNNFINSQPSGVQISFHGFDKNGKKVFYSANQTMLKVSIFDRDLKHEERQEIGEEEIYKNLVMAIKGD